MIFDLNTLKRINNPKNSRISVYALDDNRVLKIYTNPIDFEKQFKAKEITDKLNTIQNKIYKIPKILEFNKDELYIIEERINGLNLTSELFNSMNTETKNHVINSLAGFCNDINQSKPVLNQYELFNTDDKINNLFGIDNILEKIKDGISEKDLNILINSYKWFKNESKKYSNIVFSQSDFHKDNIFYNPKTRVVSILDFADSKYEEVNSMLSNMGLMYSYEIIDIYKKLPRKQNINFNKNEIIDKLRNSFSNFQISASEFIMNKNENTQKELTEDIKKIISLSKFVLAIDKTKKLNTNLLINKISQNKRLAS